MKNNITFLLFTKAFHKNLRNARFLTWHSQHFLGLNNFFFPVCSDGTLNNTQFFLKLKIYLQTKCKRTKTLLMAQFRNIKPANVNLSMKKLFPTLASEIEASI